MSETATVNPKYELADVDARRALPCRSQCLFDVRRNTVAWPDAFTPDPWSPGDPTTNLSPLRGSPTPQPTRPFDRLTQLDPFVPIKLKHSTIRFAVVVHRSPNGYHHLSLACSLSSVSVPRCWVGDNRASFVSVVMMIITTCFVGRFCQRGWWAVVHDGSLLLLIWVESFLTEEKKRLTQCGEKK